MIKIAEAPKTSKPAADLPFEQTKCGGCTALCCSYVALEIDTPDEPADFENLRWYIIHEDMNIFVDDETWYLQIFRKCTWLKDNKCGNYENRPQICHEYKDDWCDKDGAESDLTFKTIEELETYRDEWVAEYEEEQAERRKKKTKKKGKKAKRKAKAARKASKVGT